MAMVRKTNREVGSRHKEYFYETVFLIAHA